MIIDTLKNAFLYSGSDSGIRAALEYLAKTDFSGIVPGRYDIDGDNLYALVQHYETKPREKGKWEAHRVYADVHFIVAGIETLGYAPVGSLAATQAYEPSDDYTLYAGDGDFVTASAGMFVVYFPEDAHMPCLASDAPVSVRKVVVKVAVGHLP